MFDLVSPKQWICASVCFVAGLVILYDFSLNDSISIYIMMPIDIVVTVCFFLFLRDFEKQELTEVADQ